ncbi:MAG: glycosyltransferase family 4 protein [Prolixibacteraceae bacterium]|nr:glycosyltransferase family 4 protein [Prolixibacteraceae bacterium]
MKVLIINKSYYSGGAGIAAGRLFQTLKLAGADVSLLVLDPTLHEEKKLIRLTINSWQRLKWWGMFLAERLYFLPFEKSKALRYAFSPAVAGIDISKHPAVRDADIIHLHWYNQGFLSHRSLRKLYALGKPVVHTLHDMWAFTGGCHYNGSCERFTDQCGQCIYLKNPSAHDLSFKGIQLKKDSYQNAKLTIVTCSRWLGTMAAKSSLLKEKQVLAIPNSIDINYYQPLHRNEVREALHLPSHRQLVLFGAANLNDPRKGLSYFLEVLELVKADFDIVVFGKNSVLMKQQSRYKVHDFGLIASAEKMKALYQAADVFVLPSLQDNLPNTVMESLACGTPVVAFETGGIPEMVDHLVNGYIARYQSSSELAAGIEWVLKNNTGNVLGKAAREKVLRVYSEEVVAQQYLQLYEKVLNEK